MTGPGSSLPEFNPLLFPPCACARCITRKGYAEEGAAGSGEAGGAGQDSPVLRELRARVTEENGLRGSFRSVRHLP
ncbi:hypothetical protein CP967_26630 [Streptomyces nitrosporeus]|uniref:Uncharacterized protein n=1 Tax=Streptomyces nitrosporeus TaxID=28894 RepID=A0A5J6FHV4_9ACTN|nr:hypothetical protein CP967_26630 [Streptomyces nitrosporeus]GGY91052.1 hypothetical protein GCM10010327_22200 [Streptomyces nitrosporeus]